MSAHDKPILTETTQDLSSFNFAPGFTPAEFRQAISNQGYDVLLEKAIMCPCRDRANGHVATNCKNCGATGWVFVNKKKTRALISHINQKTKYENWTEANVGTVNITTHSDDRIGYMDKITILDVETTFTQVVHLRKSSTGKLFAFLAYTPLEIDLIYLFKSAAEPLEYLDPSKYTTQDNKIILDDSFLTRVVGFASDLQYLNLTVRYFHEPVYHIVDINREVMKSRSKDSCANPVKVLKSLPISSIAKKPHVLYEIPDFSGDGLFDNSIIQ